MQRRELPPVKAERQQSCRGEALPPPGEAGRAAPLRPSTCSNICTRSPADACGSAQRCSVHSHNTGEAATCPSAGERPPRTADIRSAGPQTPRSQKLRKQNPFLGNSTGGKSQSEEPGGHSSPVSAPGRVNVRRVEVQESPCWITRSDTRLGRHKARSVLHFTRCTSQPQMNICMMYHLCSETHGAPRVLGKGLRTCLVLQWNRLQLGKQTNTNYTHLCG